jgi:hypothetical protein
VPTDEGTAVDAVVITVVGTDGVPREEGEELEIVVGQD